MKIRSFTVLPTTPAKLKPLLGLANNLWFSWNWDARQLFAKLDVNAWKKTGKNPLRTLCDVSQKKLEEASQNRQYVAELEAVYTSFKKYLSSKTWFEDQHGKREKERPLVAYFSAEYGMHESLPIYSGGLGVLSGDHLKSASDLGIPLVAIGLLYRQGYFRQGLDANGIQQEMYPENDWFSIPAVQVKDEKGHSIIVSIDLAGEEVFFQVWQVDVGRLHLYLLDTNLPINSPSNRDITKRLYDSDRDMRIRQEILLGIGGIRALKALKIEPSVFHINEGHSAFLVLERLVHLMHEQALKYDEAKEIVWSTNVFTTHTPVPEGNERFNPDLVKKYLHSYAATLKMTWNEFLALGREFPENEDEEFCMTILGLNFSSMSNGVSKLHGKISRQMWQKLYPQIPPSEIPIGHVTNGVHTLTWISKWLEGLFIRYMQTSYNRETADFSFWKTVSEIPASELWHTHLERKKGLIKFVREQIAIQRQKRGASLSEINKAEEILDPYALTIGFARRFAPYKRGDLIFRDVERLINIVTSADRPVQLIIAGKAHPADTLGKSIIKKIFDTCNRPDLYRRIVFIEDYDLNVARFLVQGVDVWLNTPRRPMEASGTSGMKAAMNGVLNLSILDGWWDEAFDGTNGWAIGHGESYQNHQYQDEVEANLLYRIIENEVVPLYYDRDEQNIPLKWMEMVKRSIQSCGEEFNAHNMLMKYLQQYYLRGEQLYHILTQNKYSEAKHLSKWRKELHANWEHIKIIDVGIKSKEVVYSGEEVEISAQIKLGVVAPDDVIVEVYYGLLSGEKEIENPQRIRMYMEYSEADFTVFTAKIICNYGGRYGHVVRILPGHPHLAVEFIPELIKWEE
ncbi:MAG: alpha-glucan family phosphorylase [Oligoflexia bacterium]|nr:alpha-glucan family phosphorylase [Oligoflexia bacterium]MBF0366619.1 alpha-glucan family phosphorylase [Oligoflexia bacterium]